MVVIFLEEQMIATEFLHHFGADYSAISSDSLK